MPTIKRSFSSRFPTCANKSVCNSPVTPQIIAHRGASRAQRENTVAAFHAARTLGAHAVELDVRLTADAVLVVHHDPRLGASGTPITHVPRRLLPADVPTLDEALDACAGMWVNVEIKNDPAEPDFDPTDHIAELVTHSLAQRNEHQRWLISSFRFETVNRCRLVEPRIATAWLTVEIPDDTIARLQRFGHRAVHPYYASVTHDFVERSHAAGVQVNVWTCDEPEAMCRLADWGVDGICTNVPDLALDVLSRR